MLNDLELSYNLKALEIAASVFSQISEMRPFEEETFNSSKALVSVSYKQGLPRTLKDFRESVDAVFKAAGLDKVEWEQ